MSTVVPTARRLAVGMAAVSVLSLGAGGLAGAATQTPTSSPPSTAAVPAHRHFNCARAPKALARIQKVEARIAAGLPKLEAAEQKAKAAGKTQRAQRIQRRIDRLESSKTKDRLSRLQSAIQAKCGVSATTGSSTGAGSGAAGASTPPTTGVTST